MSSSKGQIVSPIDALKSAWPESDAATVAGHVVRLLGRGDGALIALDDGTGWLEIWVPIEADPWGDLTMHARIEVDVKKGTGTIKWPYIDYVHGQMQEAIVSGDIMGASAAAARGFADQDFADAQAIATALRSPGARMRRRMLRLTQVAVVLAAFAFAAARFAAIDADSHSASDTLRPWLIQAVLIAVIAGGIVFLIEQYGHLHRVD